MRRKGMEDIKIKNGGRLSITMAGVSSSISFPLSAITLNLKHVNTLFSYLHAIVLCPLCISCRPRGLDSTYNKD